MRLFWFNNKILDFKYTNLSNNDTLPAVILTKRQPTGLVVPSILKVGPVLSYCSASSDTCIKKRGNCQVIFLDSRTSLKRDKWKHAVSACVTQRTLCRLTPVLAYFNFCRTATRSQQKLLSYGFGFFDITHLNVFYLFKLAHFAVNPQSTLTRPSMSIKHFQISSIRTLVIQMTGRQATLSVHLCFG